MSEEEIDERLVAVQSMLESLASLDFTKKLKLSSKADNIDAISAGLNMLSEELRSNVVKRSELEEINYNLERFAYTAAHDIKSPLNSINMLLTIIEDELGENKNNEISQCIEMVKDASERSKRIIDGILEYSRIGLTNLDMKEIDIGKICTELATQYGSKNKVEITIQGKLPIVIYAEIPMIQIFDNLINNAIKHNNKPTCKIEISCKEKPEYYVLSVADNGPGIAESQREKIFDLFENLRTKKENSTGIGLAIAKKLIIETNDRIWVDTSKNQGARFNFTINKTI